MSTKTAALPAGSLEATYTARERAVVGALTRLRSVGAPDPDTKARARDALMLILTAEHAADERHVPRASMVS